MNEGTTEIVRWASEKDHAIGLHRFAVVPADKVFVFLNVRGKIVETQGFKAPIRVYLLSANGDPIPTSEWNGGKRYLVQDAYSVLLNPNGHLNVPPGAAHVVETSWNMPPLSARELKELAR